MGYSRERFLADANIPNELVCKICSKILEDPLETPCNHVFCATCIVPWLMNNGKTCHACSRVIDVSCLRVPAYRQLADLQISCDACSTITSVEAFSSHRDTCALRPVVCPHPGCSVRPTQKALSSHTEQCGWRPIGKCTKGCQLSLLQKDQSHDCMQALLNLCSQQKSTIDSLTSEVRRQKHAFSKQEKSLLCRITSLQAEIQTQALKFQRRIADIKCAYNQLSANKNPSLVSNCQQFDITIRRDENGTLGFSIAGGKTESSDGPIFVTKISANGPARESNLRCHDSILEINGTDLRSATHEEAVNAFKKVTSAVSLKVQRIEKRASQTSLMIDISTQTDLDLDYVNGFPGILSLPSLTDLESVGLQEMDIGDLMLAEELKQFELEYEEVHFSRQNSDDRLGLTICQAPESNEGVFVSDIEPDSIAAKCTRLSKGDVISQINGKSITTADEATKIFSQSGPDFTLLISRPSFDNYDVDLPSDDFLFSDLTRQFASNHLTMEAIQQHGILKDDDADNTNDSKSTSSHHGDKDSGFGYDSNKNDSTSEHGDGDLGSIKPSTDSDSSAARAKPEKLWSSSTSTSSLDANLVMENIRCHTQAAQTLRPLQPLQNCPKCGDSLDDEGTLKADANAFKEEKPKLHRSVEERKRGKGSSEKTFSNKKSKSNKNVVKPLEDKSYMRESMVSIPAHAKQYRSYLQLVKLKDELSVADDKMSSPSCEWKVKIRPDGTRYITKATPNQTESKKSSRDRLLKKRADRINTERDLLTTDDDAVSEMKAGRYWSRNERKRQFLMARDRKLRRELMLKSHLATVREDDNIVTISRAKANSRRSVLDSYFTIQELMTHGKDNPLLSVTTV